MNQDKFLDRTACNRLLFTLPGSSNLGSSRIPTLERVELHPPLLASSVPSEAFPTPMFLRQIIGDSNQAQRTCRSGHGPRDLGVSTEPVPRGCMVVALRGGGLAAWPPEVTKPYIFSHQR